MLSNRSVVTEYCIEKAQKIGFKNLVWNTSSVTYWFTNPGQITHLSFSVPHVQMWIKKARVFMRLK